MSSTGRAIGRDVIDKLLKQDAAAKAAKDPTATTYKERWPGEVNMVRLAKAIESDSPEVVFRNGDKFTIKKYDNETVLVKPVIGFCPMGYFSLKSIKDAELKGIDPDA